MPAHGAAWGSVMIFLALVIAAGGLGWTENANDYSRYLPPDRGGGIFWLSMALQGRVRISWPSAVTRMVCSNWAVRLWSRVTAVQPSGQIL